MANKNAGKNGINTRFNGNTAVKAGRKGAEATNKIKKEKKEALKKIVDVAKEDASNDDLKEITQSVKKWAKTGSIPHILMYLKMIGQKIEEECSSEEYTYTIVSDESSGEDYGV